MCVRNVRQEMGAAYLIQEPRQTFRVQRQAIQVYEAVSTLTSSSGVGVGVGLLPCLPWQENGGTLCSCLVCPLSKVGWFPLSWLRWVPRALPLSPASCYPNGDIWYFAAW